MSEYIADLVERNGPTSAALFLTKPQLTSARGSKTTLLPPGLSVPPHWQQV